MLKVFTFCTEPQVVLPKIFYVFNLGFVLNRKGLAITNLPNFHMLNVFFPEKKLENPA